MSRLCFVVLGGMLLAGCVPTALVGSVRVDVHDDPLVGLPGGEVGHVLVTPYEFSKGLRRLEHLLDAPPQRAVARLAIARSLVDAVLYGEIAQDASLLDALIARNHWALAEEYLTPLSDEPAVSHAQRQGLALIAALRSREMNGAYHEVLDACASDGVWQVEARLARLLDLEEVLLVSGEIPAHERAKRLSSVLGGQLPDCVSTAPVEGVEPNRRDTVLIGHCGHQALGWPPDAEERLFHRSMGELTVVMARATTDLRQVLVQWSHPLVVEARGEIEAFGGRLGGRWVAVALEADAADDFEFTLPLSTGDPLEAGPFVLIDVDGAVRVGVAPMVSIGAREARFVEAEVGLGFPGQSSSLDTLPEHLTRAYSLAGTETGPTIFLPARVRVRSVAPALRVVRQSLPSQQRGELTLGVFQPGVGLRSIRIQLATGREQLDRVVDIPADGPIQWPPGAEGYVVLRLGRAVTIQRLLDVLGELGPRVGTWLVLL